MRFFHKVSFYFNLLMLCFMSVLLVMTLGYDRASRLVPLLALIPGTVLILYCLLGVFFPALISRTNVGLMGAGMQKIEADESTIATVRLAGNRGLVITTVWLVAYVALLVVFGFYISMFIALLAFFKFAANASWFKSAIIVVAVTATIYLVFNVLMGVELFKGVMFGGLFLI